MKFKNYLNEDINNIKAELFDEIYEIVKKDNYTAVRQYGLIVDIIEKSKSKIKRAK